MKKKMNRDLRIARLLESKKQEQGIKIDLGGGGNPQPGFINLDLRDLPTVDIVHNLELFPWPLPDECASLVMASHLLEHVNPAPPDARLPALVRLLLKKKIFTEKELQSFIGELEPGPLFLRFMNEVWRILRPGGQLMAALPYAGSGGMNQDPSHVNPCNEATWAYFDPLEAGGYLYRVYEPAPFKVTMSAFHPNGNIEVVLRKRLDDVSYHVNGKLKYGKGI